MAARAMLNFGLTRMRLVDPRDGWPNPAAGPAAAGAGDVLNGVEVFPDLAAAVADAHMVYVTAQRPRDMIKPLLTPAAAASRIASAPGLAAIVFGPERTGLTTEEVARGDALITIPHNPEFGSLNIAMAATVIAYELHKAGDSTPGEQLSGHDTDPATHAELEGLIAHLDAELDARAYFFPPHRAAVMRRTLRCILSRPGLSGQEVRTLRGVVKALAGEPRARSGR